MSPLQRNAVRRRGFLTAMAATSVAVSASALFAREVSAAPVSASPGAEQRVAEASPSKHGAVDVSPRTRSRPGSTEVSQAPALPTIVLVHGAFAESSSWNGVIADLLEQGYPVVAAANPLRGLSSDAAYVASVLAGIQGPVVLVGHSYGGSVITNAATSNVTALVYVAAFALDVGESTSDLASRYPGSTLGAALAPPVVLADGGQDLYIQQDKFRTQFAADVPEFDARQMAATQRPITTAALNEASGTPAWKSIQSWFIYGDQDRNVPPAALAFMADRAGAREMIEIEGASHVIMVSHPGAVAEQIRRAAQAGAATATS